MPRFTRWTDAYQVTTTTTTTTTTNDFQVNAGELSTTQSVGDFITDIRFLPFLRSKQIKIYVTGLKPDTRHYFFFDKVDVNDYIAPAKLKAQTVSETVLERMRPKRGYGLPVRTDSNGVLLALFLIPEDTFLVGSNTLQVCDVDDLANIDIATSKAKAVYRGFNYSVEKQETTISTREPEISVDSSEIVDVTRSVTTISESNEDGQPPGPGGRGDGPGGPGW